MAAKKKSVAFRIEHWALGAAASGIAGAATFSKVYPTVNDALSLDLGAWAEPFGPFESIKDETGKPLELPNFMDSPAELAAGAVSAVAFLFYAYSMRRRQWKQSNKSTGSSTVPA